MRFSRPITLFRCASVGLLVIASAACGSSGGVAKPLPPTMTACVVDGVSARCGTLRVPEDRSNPSGRQIDLRVVVIPALNASPKADPLVALAGGPGGAASQDLVWTASTFDALHADRDIVLVDQRGTGDSNRLALPALPDTTGLSKSEAVAKLQAWSTDALPKLQGDPRFYTTSVAMDDLDAVRAALGYDKINLYGPSYGATAAQYYVRQHGDHVRSVVLDGGTLLDVPIFERIAPNSQRALDILFRRCASDKVCGAVFPDLGSEYAAVIARLAKEPVTLENPTTGETGIVDANAIAQATHSALLDYTLLPSLPSLIHSAFVGDWERIARIVASLPDQTKSSEQLAMSTVIRCSEAWARFDPAETARLGTGSYLGDSEVAAADTQAALCAVFPKGVVTSNDAQPVASNVPTLIILGEADPQNPPANVADAPKELPNSLTVVVPGQAHTVGSIGCMPDVISAFVEAGTTKGLDVSCVATGVPLPPFQTA